MYGIGTDERLETIVIRFFRSTGRFGDRPGFLQAPYVSSVFNHVRMIFMRNRIDLAILTNGKALTIKIN